MQLVQEVTPGFHHMTVPGNQPKKKKRCMTNISESTVNSCFAEVGEVNVLYNWYIHWMFEDGA